ncbi:peptide chain release factor N(5)-glutamine methyltransferase [Halanaerobaculum tunisiense]
MAPLTVKEILGKTVDFFSQHEISSPRLDAEVLLAAVLDLERIKLYVNFNRPLTTEEINRYRELVVERSQGQPVAYLLGRQEFMSLEFKVTSDVLVPRPETEHLVESALEEIEQSNHQEFRVADIGTGSGAIIISLVKLAAKTVTGVGVDISEAALKVAYENALQHNIAGRIDFKAGDLLQPIEESVDLIVSNPPYIPAADLADLPLAVQQEPELALAGGEDGLDYYRQIINQAPAKLAEEGLIALEVGANQASAVAELLTKAGSKEVEIQEDYAGIERVVLGRL